MRNQISREAKVRRKIAVKDTGCEAQPSTRPLRACFGTRVQAPGSIGAGAEEIKAAADTFAQILAIDNRKALSATIQEGLAGFGITSVDLFSLALVATFKIDVSKREAKNRSELLRNYCEAFLASHSPRGSVTLLQAAELAYRYFIAQEQVAAEEILGNPCWTLVHKHALIRDFLLGFFVIEKLKAIGSRKDSHFARLAHVYPHGIDRNCKEIMNLNSGNQRNVLAAAA